MAETPRPTWEPIWLACRSCKHEWDDWQPCMVRVSTWVAHCRAYCCPSCGKGIDDIIVRSEALKAGASDG